MEIKTPDVYRAICQVAKAISRDGISKDKSNQQQGYKFRGIDDIYNALSAVIAGAELCILPRMAERTQEERTTAKGGVLFYVTVRADFDFVSARDGSKHTVTMYGEAMDSADKATNKAMSAAYKYACLQVFCIPTEGMDDADAHTPEPAPKAKHTPAQQAVVDRKLAEADSRPKVEPKPWDAQFKEFFLAVGAEEYSRLLGSEGYESSRLIPDQVTAKKVLDRMKQAHDATKKGAAA
jgi:hypothetical protein